MSITNSSNKYKVRVKNAETKTSWTLSISRDSSDDDGSYIGSSIAEEVFNLLEDTDFVSDLKELSDSVIGIEPSSVSWNEKILKVTFEDVEDDSDVLEVIEALREHLEDIIDDCVTEDPEED